MAYRLVHTNTTHKPDELTFEMRDTDPDGGEMVVTAIFSLRTLSPLTNRQLEWESCETRANY